MQQLEDTEDEIECLEIEKIKEIEIEKLEIERINKSKKLFLNQNLIVYVIMHY